MQFNASTLPMPCGDLRILYFPPKSAKVLYKVEEPYTLLRTHLVKVKISGWGSHGDEEAESNSPGPSAVADFDDGGFTCHELSTHRWKGLQRLPCKPDAKRLSILHANPTLHGSLLVGWQFKVQLHQQMQHQRRLSNTLRLQEMHVQVQVHLCQLAHLPHPDYHTLYPLSYSLWLLNCVL